MAAVAAAFASLTEDRPERPARVVEARTHTRALAFLFASANATPSRPLQCCALSGEGLRSGVAWALEAVRSTRRARLLDAAATGGAA